MLTGPLESLLNRNVAASASARALCKRLAGKTLALHVAGLPLNIFLSSHGERLVLDSQREAPADASLTGSPLSFLRMVGPKPEAALRSGAVQIQGDAEVAQAFSELLREAQPDLEEELSRIIGDVAAHQVGNAARSALAFAERAAKTFAQNVAEFLQEESRDLPSRTEADEFIAGVDKVRDDVERLEARIARLESGSAK
jgi:ubiquinone biosynthesis protein UbiJ